MAKEKPLLTIKVRGKGLKSGHIPIPLLLKICGEAQRAVNRQAEALAGNPSLRPGRHTTEVTVECTLDLVGLKKGSTTLQFVPASENHSLLGIGLDAVSGVGGAIRFVSQERPRGEQPNVGVLAALNGLGEVFRPDGVESIKWIVPAHNGTRRATVEFNEKVYHRLKQRIQLPLSPFSIEKTPNALEGTLELTEGKGRIVPPVGSPTSFIFGPDKAVAVLEASGKPVKLTLGPKTNKLQDIELASLFGKGDFFASKTIDQLIAEQHVKPITDFSTFESLSDDDVDDLIAEIHQGRQG